MNLTSPAVAEEGLQDEIYLREVLRSQLFERSSSLSRLLSYLWEQRGREISEYALATEALGRPSSFDSKIDATVRVQIGRLRRLLDRFYAADGTHHTRRLTIPTGSHDLIIVRVQGVASAMVLPIASRDSAELVGAPRPEVRPIIMRPLVSAPVGYSLLGSLLLCAVLLAMGLAQRRTFAKADPGEAPQFWKTFLDNGKNTRIVLPAPLFFAWNAPNGHSLMLRDITVNDPAKWADSSALTGIFGKQEKIPDRWQNYTVASDTFASLQLARFLDHYGIRTSFSSSANLSSEIVDRENIVTFGTKSSLAAYQADLDRLTFRMGSGEERVTDLLSPPEHPTDFPRVHEPGERDVVPGIIAVIPRPGSDCRLMLVQGAETMALIAYLTSTEGMREIMDATQGMQTPYFEAVILSEVNRGTPLQSRLGAIRAFKERPPQMMAKLLQVQQSKR